jgi:hypothetical protein
MKAHCTRVVHQGHEGSSFQSIGASVPFCLFCSANSPCEKFMVVFTSSKREIKSRCLLMFCDQAPFVWLHQLIGKDFKVSGTLKSGED